MNTPLVERYQAAIDDLFKKVRDTQSENIQKAGELVANVIENGGAVYLSRICHSIENDLIYRGGGPIFYKHFSMDLKVEANARIRKDMKTVNKDRAAARYALETSNIMPGDVLFLSSVSGRSSDIVELAYEAQQYGVHVVALVSMSYAVTVDAVHESGLKLYEIAELTLDNCAPAAEAMLDVEGIEAKFAAASGIASDYIMWSLTGVAVEKMLKDGYTPGILKSANFPGGNDYNKTVIEPHYDEYGW